MAGLDREIITEVIRYCKRDIVPDETFSIEESPSNWFCEYFSFLGDEKIQRQLGDAFYQARFLYKLMCGLRLKLSEQRGVVKFQIVQYASICEAVLDVAISKYFKTEAEKEFSVTEFHHDSSALASNVKLSRENKPLYICREKKKKGDLKRTRVDAKTKFAAEKGLLTQDLKDRLDALYDLRNNIHIIKAAETEYDPKLREARDGFELMRELVGFIRDYYQTHAERTNENPGTAE